MGALMCQPSTVKNLDFVASKFGDFLQTFQARYKREFGFSNPGRDIINVGSRVGCIGLSGVEDHAQLSFLRHKSKCMSCDHMIHGPLIVINKNSTILVEPDCKAEMTKKCDITIMIGNGIPKHIGKESDAVQLSIFSHRLDH
ncbi:unnamed protein product [Clavelina lepadiformis]|uniref:Glutamine--fructose-6-phosphate transaminase (isomerizing) n=1 Tax=Clavelina lepadiformis TaxID=159417 RepID=A0ABP0FQK5_CLALP